MARACLLSFAGIVVAFGVPTPGGHPRELLGDVMMVLAAVAWGVTTLVVKASKLVSAPYEKTLLYQLIVSAPILAFAAQVLGERVTVAAVRDRDRFAGLSDPMGCGLYLPRLVRAGSALLREPALRFHVSHALVRRRGRVHRAVGAADAGLRGGGGAGDCGVGAGQPATVAAAERSAV